MLKEVAEFLEVHCFCHPDAIYRVKITDLYKKFTQLTDSKIAMRAFTSLAIGHLAPTFARYGAHSFGETNARGFARFGLWSQQSGPVPGACPVSSFHPVLSTELPNTQNAQVNLFLHRRCIPGALAPEFQRLLFLLYCPWLGVEEPGLTDASTLSRLDVMPKVKNAYGELPNSLTPGEAAKVLDLSLLEVRRLIATDSLGGIDRSQPTKNRVPVWSLDWYLGVPDRTERLRVIDYLLSNIIGPWSAEVRATLHTCVLRPPHLWGKYLSAAITRTPIAHPEIIELLKGARKNAQSAS